MNRYIYREGIFFLTLFCVFFFTNGKNVQASTCVWVGTAGDGLASTAGNWSSCPSGTPQPTDSVTINATSNAISWDSSASSTVANITLATGYTGTFTVNKNNVTVTTSLTVGAGTLTFGSTYAFNAGTLSLTGGILAIASGTLNLTSGSTVTGGSITSNSDGSLGLTGDFTVTSPGTVTAGTITPLGTGSIGGTGTFTSSAFTSTGNATTTLAGNLTVAGSCSVGSNSSKQSVLMLSSYSLSCGSFTNVSNGQKAGAYTYVQSGTLTVTGNTTITNNGFTASSTSAFYGGTGTLNFNGNLTVDNYPSINMTGIHQTIFYAGTSGTMTVGGDVNIYNNKDISLTKAAPVLFDGGSKNISITGALFVDSTNVDTIVFNAGSSGTLTVSGTSTIFKVEGTSTGATTTFNGQAKNLTFTNGVTVQKASGALGEVFFTPSTDTNTYNFTLNKPTGYLSFATTSTITGALTITAGTLYINGTTTVTSGIANSDTIILGSYPLKKSSSLSLDKSSYTIGTDSSLTITLTDFNRNTVGTTSQTLAVAVVTNSDSESVTLTETGVATGIFTATLPLSQSSATLNDGTLEASEATTISVSYTDNQDSTDSSSGSAALTAASTSGSSTGAILLSLTVPLYVPGNSNNQTQSSTTSNQPSSGGTVPLVGPFAFGVSGEQVKVLQSILARDNAIYPEGLTTGYYGTLTKKAVGRFQERYGLAKTSDSFYGLAGPITRAKINEILGQTSPTQTAGNESVIQDLKRQIETLQNQITALLQEKLLQLKNQASQ